MSSCCTGRGCQQRANCAADTEKIECRIFPDFRLIAAIGAGKNRWPRQPGTGPRWRHNLPGVVARRIAPDTLRRLSAGLPDGVAVIGGTNGKTTTTRMIAAILQGDGRRVLHNRAGANLVSRLTAAALAGSSLNGQVHADIGLFETDEAALPQAVQNPPAPGGIT
ncbi:MAG: hypothetical protein U0074_12265 [Kouleothrix sp.]